MKKEIRKLLVEVEKNNQLKIDLVKGDSRLYKNGKPVVGTPEAKMYFQVVATSGYSDSPRFAKFSEAKDWLNNFGTTNPKDEYYEHYKNNRDAMSIIRIHEVTDVVRKSNNERVAISKKYYKKY
jgi:hypothetical protein